MSLNLNSKRRITQALAAVLLTSNAAGTGLGRACIPILCCEACSLTWLGCPIGVMSSAIAFHEFPWLVLCIVLATSLVVGRWLCGWICPTGLVQDLLYKIPSPIMALPRWMSFIKYLVLLVTVVGIAFVYSKETAGFFCTWCPTATVSVAIPDLVRTRSLAWDWSLVRLVILGLVILAAVLNHRFFCKVLCPVGAMVALAGRYSWLAIRMEARKCGRCRQCDQACPMEVKVVSRKDTGTRVNSDPECVNCLSCEAVCRRDAITNNSRILGKS